jgi:ABC-type antimicrobial peptide transport system permease subunit
MQIAVLAMVGVAVGICAALGAAVWMRSLVYGISASDPASMAASAMFVAAIALLASIIPARRAIRIDPAESLRTDG